MPIDTHHPEYAVRLDDWRMCRDLAAGEAAVKLRRATYLPPLEGHAGENDPAYQAYLKRAMFYPAFDRTVTGLSGLVLRKPGVVHVPAGVVDLLDDLTLERDGGLQGVYVRVLREVLTTGRLGVLVDWNEQLKRPYWTLYDTEQIVNWREARVDGAWTPTLIVLEEKVAAATGDAYGSDTVMQWRELFLDDAGLLRVRLWRKTETAEGDALRIVGFGTPTRKGEPLRKIPFLALTPRGAGLSPQKPPLLDLAWVSLSHYRTSADLEHGRHFTALPTPWVTGWAGDAAGGGLKIGAGTAWIIPEEKARVGMLEFTGQGLKALEVALEQKERLMATVGARMLEQQPRAAETAEAVRLRQGGDHTTLATIVASVSAGLTAAMQWTAWWTGIDAFGDKAVEVRLNGDFVDAQLSAQEIDALVKLWQAGGISYDTLYYNLQAGEIARPGVEVDEERDQIDAEDALEEAAAPPVPIEGAPGPAPDDPALTAGADEEA